MNDTRNTANGRRLLAASARRAAGAVALAALASVAAVAQGRPHDPIERAMERVRSSVDARAKVAERVIEGAALVSEVAAARKAGDTKTAAEKLAQARELAAEDEFKRDALIAELAAAIAAEHDALNPRVPDRPELALPSPRVARLLPRSVMARYRMYRDRLAPILVEERVPVELLAVAFVESGFNPEALSPVGARGIWQFMPATARRYGLPVNAGADHRTHPEHSTRAAARYLRDLYGMFGDWKLAFAAYNAGEGRVGGVIRRTGIRDFDEMSRRGLLPAETRKYVPAVMAVWAQLRGPARDPRAAAEGRTAARLAPARPAGLGE
jgi:hypothetical protein